MASTEQGIEIRYPHGGWMAEKTRNILEQLAYFIDAINGMDDLDDATRDKLRTRIGMLLHDATKVFADSYGAPWGPFDRDRIMEQGYEGYRTLCKHYAVWVPTNFVREPETWSVADFVTRAGALLGGTRAQSRTLLHSLLRDASLQNPYVEQFAQALEYVTQGDLDWEDFQAQGGLILRQLEKKFGISGE